MGKLLGLELNNFKSYKGLVKINFGDSNFISVIGPNGSGKSNLMDAISFVLGINNLQLRSSKLLDLIYMGSNTPRNNESNSAHVTLFYKKDINSDTIFQLKRSINYLGQSFYFINDEKISFTDYSSFLNEQKIILKAKNFLVFQGDIEQIASQSPKELTKLLENVSGSIQYADQYNELNDSLQNLNNLTNESIRNRRRIYQELKNYKENINKNNQYLKNLRIRDTLIVNFQLWQLWQLYENKKKLIDSQKPISDQIYQANENLETINDKIKSIKEDFNIEYGKLIKLKNSFDSNKNKLEKLQFDNNLIHLPKKTLTKKICSLDNKNIDLQQQIDVQSEYIEKLNNQLKVVQRTKGKFEDELSNFNKNFNKYKLNNDDLNWYNSLNEIFLFQRNGNKLIDKIAILKVDKDETISKIKQFTSKIEHINDTIIKDLNMNLSNHKNKLQTLKTLLNDKNSNNLNNLNKLKFLQTQLETNNKKEFDLNYKLRETLLKIDELNATQRESNNDKKLRENVISLKRLFPGVKGLVHDLCHPKKDRFAIAVSTVLGRNFNSIIVDNLNTAQNCIDYLKKQRSGSASFIPLDSVENELTILPNFDNSGNYMLAKNAIEYEPIFEKAIQYVCGDSIICDNLEIAKDLKWNKKIKNKLICLDGSLIHKSGLMTGGASKNNNNRWDKEYYQSLLTLKDTLLHDIEDISNKNRSDSILVRELEENISVINDEIISIRTELNQVNRSIDECNNEITYQNELINKEFNLKINSLNEKHDEISKKIETLEKEKDELQSIVFKEFNAKLGFSVKEYENHSNEVVRLQNKELQQLQKELLNIENKLQFEKNKLTTMEKRISKNEINLEQAKNELATLEMKAEKQTEEIDKITKELEVQKSEIDKIQTKIDENQLEINKYEDEINELQLTLNNYKNKENAISEDIEKMDIERLGILKNCKISNIDLPVVSEITLADIPITSNENDALAISNDIEIEFDKLPNNYKQDSIKVIKKEFDEKIKDINQVLDVTQPNAHATERYNEAQARFDIVDNETESLKAQERKIHDQFLKVKKKRKELFNATFNHVSKHLEVIYRELTRDPNSSAQLAGGNASLTVEDEDEPFNAGIKYHATPPLKRFKDMEYLSGGEKTIAALALLFAINSYHQSPFFVLDEIDAALDIVNVERIATYIRRHGNPDLQFIVISLKNNMFEKSDALVGVYRQQEENASRIVTLDLSQYAD